VAAPVHVTRVANRTLDQVRRRVQNETLGHRGRKVDPLFRIRELLLRGDQRLDERGRDKMMAGLCFGDPHDEVLGAWLAKEAVTSTSLSSMTRRSCRPAPTTPSLRVVLDEVAEIRTLGHTL
jgi:hypothetical protein